MATVVKKFSQKTLEKKELNFCLRKSRLSLYVVLFLLLYLAISFTLQFKKLTALQLDLKVMQKQVVELKARNAELNEQLKKVQSDSYIEQTAREKLGLIKPGETRIVQVKPENGQ